MTQNSQNSDPADAEHQPSKGEASRAAILLAAAKLATTNGLDGFSIGDLAAAVGMSKSGLYAHFKSKEELELATIETAAEIFDREVLKQAETAQAGVPQIRALVEAFLAHLERRVFPGGCFFAAVAAELDTRPGPTRDRVVAMLEKWGSLFTQCLLDAQASGEIYREIEVAQAAFEIQALLLAANFQFVMTSDPLPLKRARRGVEHVLERLAVPEHKDF